MIRRKSSAGLDDTGKMREHLTINMKEEKIGYDNPALAYDRNQPEVKFRKISNVNGPNDKSANTKRDQQLKGLHVPNPIQNKNQAEKEYEPYDNRVVKHKTTYFETLIHMLKASLGTGILAMPEAFHNAGYVVATIGTLAIGLLCTYSIHILISTEYELCKRKQKPSMTYPETAQAAVLEGPKALRGIAPAVPHICNLFLLMYQIGSCCIYVIFISQNIEDVCVYYFPNNSFTTKSYIAMLLVPLILINWVRNLKYLAPLSTIANVVTIFSFAIIFYYMFIDLPSINTRSAVGSLKSMPLFFGTVLFAMEAIGVVMPLENEMKNPRRFGSVFGVLNCAMLPITLLYTFVGFFGYLQYGPNVKAAITFNLPNQDVLAQSARLLLAFAIFITHALACYVAIDIIWREYIEPRVTRRKLFYEYILRTVLVGITITLAATISKLEIFIPLIGALCLSAMGLAFPGLIQLFTFWDYYDGIKFGFFFMKNMAIVLIALFGLIVGTATSALEIKKYFTGS